MSVIKEVEKRLRHNKIHEEFLLETLELLKEKEEVFKNEIAYCKIKNELKPCVIVGVDLPNFNAILNEDRQVYVRVQTKNGSHAIALDDIIPYNDKSKILFGR